MSNDMIDVIVRRVPASEIKLGNRIAIMGDMHVVVEWIGVNGDVTFIAGKRLDGRAHVSSLSDGALVEKVIAWVDPKDLAS